MNFVEKTLTYAPEAFRHLRGFMCIFKPADKGATWLKETLKLQICEGLNAMEQRPIKTSVEIVGSIRKDNLEVVKYPSYSDNPLAVGPRYQKQDIKLITVHPVMWGASGVTLVAASASARDLNLLRSSHMIRTYHIDCILGISTDTGRSDGKVTEKKKYHHVTPALIEKHLTSIQSQSRREAYEYAGVLPGSEEAYKLMCTGLIRPQSPESPALIYSIKCLNLDPPNFTLELQVLNETEIFLCSLISRLGTKLRTAAAAERLRLMRLGPFTAEMALLQRNWRLGEILNNIVQTNRTVDEIRFSGLFEKPVPGSSILRVVDG